MLFVTQFVFCIELGINLERIRAPSAFCLQVMDGFEMVRRYRQFESTLPVAMSSAASEPRAPMAIVGMSANTDLASLSLATDAGMNAFLPKPFSAADMQATLDLFGR